MEYPQNHYRLTFTTLKSNQKPFKMSYLFPKSAEGLETMKYKAAEHKRLVHSPLYNKIGFADASFFVTMEDFKRVSETFEIADEITHYKIK